jgi:hypothetical protein
MCPAHSLLDLGALVLVLQAKGLVLGLLRGRGVGSAAGRAAGGQRGLADSCCSGMEHAAVKRRSTPAPNPAVSGFRRPPCPRPRVVGGRAGRAIRGSTPHRGVSLAAAARGAPRTFCFAATLALSGPCGSGRGRGQRRGPVGGGRRGARAGSGGAGHSRRGRGAAQAGAHRREATREGALRGVGRPPGAAAGWAPIAARHCTHSRGRRLTGAFLGAILGPSRVTRCAPRAASGP